MPLSMGTLPDWARAYSNVIDPRTRAEFGAQDVGDGSATVGFGTGEGVYSGLPDHLFDTVGVGIDATRRINQDRLAEFLGQNQMREAYGPNNQMARWSQDHAGNVAGPVDVFSTNDNAFRNAALAAMAITGANIAAAGAGGAGAGAAVAPTGTSAGTSQLTPALIESAVGSAGYGASSAGSGAAANLLSPAAVDALYNMPAGWQQAAGGVAASQAQGGASAPTTVPTPASSQPSPTPGLGMPSLGDMAGNLLSNPQALAALLGGLLGGSSGGSSGGAAAPAGPPVQWTSGLQMGIQPTARRATPSALSVPNRFAR